ncbi:MAG: transglycosylase SLT domain-containing protein [Candidatus Margulisiibacteriota bacterium]|nr:transglycosylase SLT domain-containing protein [Candidatus Margulisiibacteriota bacterium]
MRLKITLTILVIALFCTASIAQTLEARDAFKKGCGLLQDGKNFSAINQFKYVVKDYYYPLNDYAYFYIGEAYKNAKYPKYAIQVYRILSKHYKNSILLPKALFAIAECQSGQKDHANAISTLRELIARYPKDRAIPHARYLLGENLEKTDKHIAAARVYRNLDLFHPKSEYSEKALEQLDKLAKKSSLAGYEAPAATIYNLGTKYFNRRNYTRAKEYFSRITKYYKKSSFYDEANIMLGRTWLRKGKLKRASRYFMKAINLNKDSKPEAMYYLARTYAYMEKFKASIVTLEKIVDKYPNSHTADNALFYIGRYQLYADATKEALAAYEKLVAKYPHSPLFPDVLFKVGNNYYKKKDYKKAYQHFSRALDLPQDKVTDRLLFWVGKSAEKMGNRDKALAAYRQTIAQFDHSYYAYRAREILKTKPSLVPEVLGTVGTIDGESEETSYHEKKYRELLALGMGDEAAEEAEFLIEKVPLTKKDKAQIAKYHAYIMKGKFGKPIWFADKKINQAMLSGSLSELEPRLWRFSHPRGFFKYVEKYSKENGLDPYLTYAIIREESRFKSRALSRSWAHGLMQIIPSTGRRICRALGIRYSRWKMYDPRVNIRMGTYYLAQLIKRFDGNVSYAVAGYNGGPVRVQRWIKKYGKNVDIDEFVEDIPFKETRNYVKKVMKSYYGYKRTYSGG